MSEILESEIIDAWECQSRERYIWMCLYFYRQYLNIVLEVIRIHFKFLRDF